MATRVAAMACGRAGDQPAVRKGPWTLEEDLILVGYISEHGEGSWDNLARAAGLNRNGKSCRLRWLNYLRPGVRHGSITPAEDAAIRELHAALGNKWSKISKQLPGRTDNEIKNYWRTRIQKKPAAAAAKAPHHEQPPAAAVVCDGASSAAGDYYYWCGAKLDPAYQQAYGSQKAAVAAATAAAAAVVSGEGASSSAPTSQDSSAGAGDWRMQQTSSCPYYSELLMSSVSSGHGETAVGVDALTTAHFSSSGQFSDSFWNAVENFWETKPVAGAF